MLNYSNHKIGSLEFIIQGVLSKEQYNNASPEIRQELNDNVAIIIELLVNRHLISSITTLDQLFALPLTVRSEIYQTLENFQAKYPQHSCDIFFNKVIEFEDFSVLSLINKEKLIIHYELLYKLSEIKGEILATAIIDSILDLNPEEKSALKQQRIKRAEIVANQSSKICQKLILLVFSGTMLYLTKNNSSQRILSNLTEAIDISARQGYEYCKITFYD